MNIVYVANDKYARHLGVSIYSLLDNNSPKNEINIYVLSMGMSQDSKEKLKFIAQSFAANICIKELTDITERFGYEVDTGKFDISAMGRFFIGDMLPDDMDRVIYLDCDTVVINSINHLWQVNLKDKVVGAVIEPTIYKEIKADLGLGDDNAYFNSGVLVIDLKKWRQEKVGRQLIDYYKEINKSSLFCDQDAINRVLKKKISILSPRYNFMTNYRYFKYRDLVAMSKTYAIYSKYIFKKAKEHPAIIHFAGDERPWRRGNLNHYRYAYDKYLKLSPWREVKKEKGSELYMLMYHAMNYVTVVCPEIRKKISKKYYEKLKKDRDI